MQADLGTWIFGSTMNSRRNEAEKPFVYRGDGRGTTPSPRWAWIGSGKRQKGIFCQKKTPRLQDKGRLPPFFLRLLGIYPDCEACGVRRVEPMVRMCLQVGSVFGRTVVEQRKANARADTVSDYHR